jgi:release factor glutamine methyltransferase
MMRGMPTAGEVLSRAERELKSSRAIEHPHAGKERYDAEQLLAFVLGADPADDLQIERRAMRRFDRLLSRRAAGEPVAYLTGRTEFAGLELDVGPGAFIPRESSEFMVEQALRRLRGRRRAVHVDLATGVGPVALAVAAALPRARVFGVDLYPSPVALARRNAGRLRLSNVRFSRGDLFDPLPRSLRGSVDVITIHPPYVGRGEIRELPAEIRRYEPRESLTDRSPAGMGLLQRVAARSTEWLGSGGWLLVEVSPDRSRAASAVLRRAGLSEVRSTKGGVEVSRVVVGRLR